MTDGTQAPRTFRRADGVLWRDAGSHIVALPASGGDVVVVGGGGAQLWRLLQRPQSLEQLVGAFVDETGAPPAAADVAAAAAALVDRGVVLENREG